MLGKAKRTLIALTVVGSLLAVFAPSSVIAATIQNPTTVTVTEEESNEKHASAGTFIKFKVLSYVKAEGLTKEEVANAEECTKIGEGTDVPVYTNSGISSSGAFVEFEDRDREKACKVNGVWRLVRCGNVVHFEVRPNIFHGQVLLVKTFAFKKIRIHIPLHINVSSKCGSAESVAKIDQWVRYRAVVKAKGDVKIRISGKIIDRVKAHVRAGVTCKTTTTTTTEPCSTCNPVKPPIVTNIETINDMEVSLPDSKRHRSICFEAIPAPGESLSDLEVALRVSIGEVSGKEAVNVGGNKFCQEYEPPSEPGTETYWGWARSKKTGAVGESEKLTFPVREQVIF